MRQATTVADVYEALCKRDRLELTHAKAGVDAADRADLRGMVAATKAMGEARRSSSIYVAQEVQKDRPFVCTTTVVWYRECERLEGYFSADSRGKLERAWLLGEEDLLTRFTTYLKSLKRVTVHQAWQFVNNCLLRPDKCGMSAVDLHEKYGLSLPLSQNTERRWMKRAGCKYERATQTYYTDGHNKPDVVKYRDETHIEQLWRISLRLPLWVQVEITPTVEEQMPRLKAANNVWKLYEFEVDDRKFVEFHVDRLAQAEGEGSGCLSGIREKLGDEGGACSVRWNADFETNGCPVNHDPAVCKCMLKAYHVGQDEACFKAFLREGNEWVIGGVRGLRKKSEGPGLMVSAFQDEIRGFGFRISERELAEVNAFRATRGRDALDASPGTRFLELGASKEGYWTGEMFFEQAMDLLDCFETLYPDRQVIMEVDHSSGHAKLRVGGLYTQTMNAKWGGKAAGMRDTAATAECLGPEEAKVTWQGREIDCKLKPGDTQRMRFQPGDPAPFYALTALPVECRSGKTKKDKDGVTVDVMLSGYEGKPKGKRHVLWERGLWKDGMKCTEKTPDHLHMDKVLGECPDFKNEKFELQHQVESRGHRVLMSPK